MTKGLKQGERLSTLLFINIRNKIVRLIRDRGTNLDTIIEYRNIQPVTDKDVLYADDLVLMANLRNRSQQLTSIWTKEIE